MEKLPSNSHTAKMAKKKVVRGTVKQQKKPWSKQIIETFVGEEIDSVGNYILHDVVIPAIKSTLSDAVQGGIEMLLFGERGSHRSNSRTQGRPNISYTNYSKPNNRPRRNTSGRGKNISDIVLDSRVDAQEVLNSMVDLIEEYGQVSIADLNELIGVTGKYTDNDYGWDNLNTARITRVREGYLLDLPKPIYIN